MFSKERAKITKCPLFIITIRGFITRAIRGMPLNIFENRITYLIHIRKRADSVKLSYYRAFCNSQHYDLAESKRLLDKELESIRKSASPYASIRESIIQRKIDFTNSKIDSIDKKVDSAYWEIISAYLSGYYFGVIPFQVLEGLNNEKSQKNK